MRFLPTFLHGILDYLIGLAIILAPRYFHYNHNGPETWWPTVIVAAMFIYDIFTDYETGLIKLMPMSAHLWFDLACGTAIIASPWLFGFTEVVFWPQVILGSVVLLNSLFSESLPSYASKGGGD